MFSQAASVHNKDNGDYIIVLHHILNVWIIFFSREADYQIVDPSAFFLFTRFTWNYVLRIALREYGNWCWVGEKVERKKFERISKTKQTVSNSQFNANESIFKLIFHDQHINVVIETIVLFSLFSSRHPLNRDICPVFFYFFSQREPPPPSPHALAPLSIIHSVLFHFIFSIFSKHPHSSAIVQHNANVSNLFKYFIATQISEWTMKQNVHKNNNSQKLSYFNY